MKSFSKFWMSLASMTLVLGLAAQSQAADTASIKVTVTGQDGKPAASVSVRLLAPPGAAPAAAPEKAKEKAAPADKPAAAADGAKPTKLQDATTDDKGEATLTKIAAGDYIVAAGNKEAGQGRQKVSVKAGETASVTITLKAQKAK